MHWLRNRFWQWFRYSGVTPFARYDALSWWWCFCVAVTDCFDHPPKRSGFSLASMTSSEIAIMSVVASLLMISGDNTIFVTLSSLSVKLVLVRRVVAKAPLRVVPVTSFAFFAAMGVFSTNREPQSFKHHSFTCFLRPSSAQPVDKNQLMPQWRHLSGTRNSFNQGYYISERLFRWRLALRTKTAAFNKSNLRNVCPFSVTITVRDRTCVIYFTYNF